MFLQVLHSLSKERLELVMGLSDYVSDRVTPLLKPVDKCWQPADYLPDSGQEDYLDQVSQCPFLYANAIYTGACMMLTVSSFCVYKCVPHILCA